MERAAGDIQSDSGASSGREPDSDRAAPSPAGRGLQPDRTVWHVDYYIYCLPESPWIYDSCDMAGYELPDEDVCRDAGVLSAEQVVARFIGLAAGKGGYETTGAQ